MFTVDLLVIKLNIMIQKKNHGPTAEYNENIKKCFHILRYVKIK